MGKTQKIPTSPAGPCSLGACKWAVLSVTASGILRAGYQGLGALEASGCGEQLVSSCSCRSSWPSPHLGWLVTSVLLCRCPPILGLVLTLLSQF